MAITLDALRERAKAWTEPVSADAPAGKSAKFEPEYEALTKEVSKLEAASGGSISSVNWQQVVQQGSSLLQKNSKDLLVASYFTYGLYVTAGFDGLANGLTALAELMDRYWQEMFPEVARLRGRANALGWLVTRLGNTLPDAKVAAKDRAAVEALAVAAARLSEVTRAKFESNAPALGPMTEAVERIKQSLPPEAPPPPPPPPPGTATAAATSTAPAGGTAQPTLATPALAAPAAGADPTAFLREVGNALVTAAGTLRRAAPTEPLGYRLVRTGLWLQTEKAPPSGPGGKTSIPPLPPALREKLSKMGANGKWAEVLEESESSLTQHRFHLDLQRFSAQALGALGATHKAARDAVLGELANFLRRVPTLPELLAADGAPLADGETRAFLDGEVKAQGAAGSGGKAAGAGQDGVAAALSEARALVGAGQLEGAIALLQEKVETARDARIRYRLRLDLAKLCAGNGQRGLAMGILDALDKEGVTRGLDDWEPALAAECLESLLQCQKAMAQKGQPGVAADFTVRYYRLCHLDPAAALRVNM